MDSKKYTETLQFYIKHDIISFEDAMSLSEDKLMNKILSQVHPYSIFYSESDNRWHTTIADATRVSGRKSIARKKKCDLERFLFEHYHLQQNMESKSQKTFGEIYCLVQERKLQFIKNPEKLLSAQNTQVKNNSDYRRYFSDTDFERTPIDELTKKDVEDICLFNLQRYDMKKKAFASIRGILKSVFDYAYSEYLIIDNVFLRVNFKQFENMFISAVPIQKRIHSNDEINSFIAELHRRQQNRPMYSSVWAMELQILIGLRRGEIPALTWDKVSENGILICQEQLTTSDNHFVIVNHTKTYKDRLFPLTDDLKDFLARLKQMHDTYYPNSIYLFPNRENTAPITNRAVYLVYRNVCQKLGISKEKGIIKGPHSFRRNVVNSLVKSSGGNIYVASALLGHSPQVAEKNYFTGIDIDTAQAIANQRHLITKE